MTPPSSISRIEVVLPVFNEVKNLVPLVRAFDEVAEKLKGQADLSLLFVDDGSTDGSAQLLYRLHRERKDVRVVELVRNYGHAAALGAGLEHTDADASVFMDADLQDPMDALLEFFSWWKKGAMTVVAERGDRGEKNKWLFSAFYFGLRRMARMLPPINFGTHCLLDKSVVERMRQLREHNRYFPGLVAYASGPITAVKVKRAARAEGKSRVGFWGLVNLAMTAYVSFSAIPVRLVSFLGLAASGAALTAGLAFVAIKVFTDKAIPGWASMMTATAFASGLQLLCLGILGEYVARIYEEVKGRPLFLANRVLDRKSAKKAA